MPVTDPISDMIAILKTGFMAKKETVEIKRSKINESVLSILKREGFISNYRVIDDKKQGILKAYLKYAKDGTPALTGAKRISKPGRRVYVKTKDIKSVYGGIGVALISTPRGVMTDREAREKHLGGESICNIW